MNTHIAHTPQVKRLERTVSPRIIAGVCGGLARYFGLSPAAFRLGLIVLTLLAVAVLLAQAAAGAGWVLVLIAGLIVLWMSRREKKGRGIVVAVLAFTGVIVAAIATATVVAFAWFDVSLGNGVGDRVYHPTSISDVKPKYEVGVGSLRVDLSRIGPVAKETHVKASVGVGELRII